jgi:hypothetical protein
VLKKREIFLFPFTTNKLTKNYIIPVLPKPPSFLSVESKSSTISKVATEY